MSTVPVHRVADGDGGTNDIFLSVSTRRAGRVKGEAQSKGHEDDILVKRWQWGLSSAAAHDSIQASGRRQWTGLTVVKSIDRATTSLMAALATNDEVKEAVLSMRKPGDGQVEFFKITLRRGRVAQVSHDVDATGTTTEVLVLLFTEVEVEYRPQSVSGAVGGTSSFTDTLLTA